MSERAATLRRVSDDAQDVRNQQRELDAYTSGHGYTVVREFNLPDTSASKGLKRHTDALDQVVTDMADRKYTVLVVVHSSRLDRRDEDDQIDLLLRVRRAGGRIESVREPSFGKTDMAGRVVTLVNQIANAEYSRVITANVRAGNARLDAKGLYRGGRAPWGYKSSGEKHAHVLVPDEVAAPMVREVFKMISNGKLVPQVSAWLEARGVKKNNSSIAGTIRRAVYRTGRYQVTDHEGITRVHQTVPLVTAELWRSANASLDSRPATNSKPRRPHRPDYSGVLYDTHGHKLYRNYNSGKVLPGGTRARRRVYRCDQCMVTWDADRADDQVEAMMSGDTSPELEVVTIAPVQVRAERLEAVAEQLRELPMRNLSDAEEDAARLALRAERRELEAMPADAAVRHEVRQTGRTRGDAWDAMSHLERVAFLRAEPMQLRLTGKGMDVRVVRVWIPTVVSVPTDRPSLIFGMPNYPPEQELGVVVRDAANFSALASNSSYGSFSSRPGFCPQNSSIAAMQAALSTPGPWLKCSWYARLRSQKSSLCMSPNSAAALAASILDQRCSRR